MLKTPGVVQTDTPKKPYVPPKPGQPGFKIVRHDLSEDEWYNIFMKETEQFLFNQLRFWYSVVRPNNAQFGECFGKALKRAYDEKKRMREYEELY